MVVGVEDRPGPQITTAGGQDSEVGWLTRLLRSIVAKTKAFFDRIGLDGASVAASLVSTIAFVVILAAWAWIQGGDS